MKKRGFAGVEAVPEGWELEREGKGEAGVLRGILRCGGRFGGRTEERKRLKVQMLCEVESVRAVDYQSRGRNFKGEKDTAR